MANTHPGQAAIDGVTMTTIETPERKRRRRKARLREEQQWAARSGPVITIKKGKHE